MIHSFIHVNLFECKKRIFDNREKLNENQIGTKKRYLQKQLQNLKRIQKQHLLTLSKPI